MSTGWRGEACAPLHDNQLDRGDPGTTDSISCEKVLTVQLEHAVLGLEAAVENQLRVAGPDAAEIGSQLMAALKPAIHQALMDVVNMAATEVSSQLSGRRVEIRLVDGDPELTVVDDLASSPPPPPPHGDTEEEEARITLRLPGYLKELIAAAASDAGDSVNSFVVDALKGQAQPRKGGMTRHRMEIDL